MYSSPALTVNQQVEYFKEKGLLILNQALLEDTLSRISFYRLKEYGVPFTNTEIGFFVNDANEKHIIDLYVFDHFLRMAVFEAIKVIEVALRAKITNHFSLKYGPVGYSVLENFHAEKIKHSQVLDSILDEISCKKDKEQEIKNFKVKYGDERLPIWMVFEYVPFGIISQFFGILKTEDKKEISRQFEIANQTVFKSWIHNINFIRNLCAHHARLWNIDLNISPKKLTTQTGEDFFQNFTAENSNKKVFYSLTIILYLLKSINSPIEDRYRNRVKELILESSLSKQLNGFEIPMGIYSNWDKIGPWSAE